MPDNIVAFDEFEDELEISAHQIALPRVVLEGGEDVVLFKRYWFFDFLDRFEFVQANDMGVGAGTSAVGNAVAASQAEGIPAYGLCDRDRLFKEANWPMMFAVDDAAFDAATIDANTATNRRWEIEAYLLEPDIIPGWVRSHHRQAPASEVECASAVSRVVEECESLLAAQPYLATAHRCGVGVPDGQYCDRQHYEFVAACGADLGGLNDQHGTQAVIEGHVAQVLGAAPAALADRLRWLLRYVDTKRLILRLKHRLSIGKGRHKWILAEFMEQRGMRPAELEQRLVAVSLQLNS